MPIEIPKHIDDAKTLFISKSETGFETRITSPVEGVIITYIAVCKYDNDDGFYLFACDSEFIVHTDFYYDDLEEALEDAERIYQLDKIEWQQIT